MKRYKKTSESESTDFGLSISDLMASILSIFILLLCVTFMTKQNLEEVNIDDYNRIAKELEELRQKQLDCIDVNDHEIVKTKLRDYEKKSSDYFEIKKALSEALQSEFQEEFDDNLAEFDPSLLLIRFKHETTFDIGQAKLKQEFKSALDSFFPKYLNVISSSKFKDEIKEIKIEGHASKIGSYRYNMELSQRRTVSVLLYCKSIEWNPWIESRLTATGLSYSRPNPNIPEQAKKNQRVEFKIILDPEKRLNQNDNIK